MTIEERIQQLRKGKGLSQEQLAEALGVSRQAVSKWEGGQSLPEIEKLIAMSQLFSVSVDYILTGNEPSAGGAHSADPKLGAQVVCAVSAMLMAVALVVALGSHLYQGLLIECAGAMLLLVSWFLGGGRALSRPLFVANVLLAGVLPSLCAAQLLFGRDPGAAPLVSPGWLLALALTYLVICAVPLYFALARKGNR